METKIVNNLKNILKIYALERDLNPDDLALLNTLRALTESEREVIVEALLPGKAKGGSSAVSGTAKRKIEHCGVCDFTRRAAHHKDTSHRDYHEFDGGGSRKSVRASGMAAAISSSLQRARGPAPAPVLCDYSVDGKVCHGTKSDGIHDSSMGYAAYHEFQPPVRSVGAGG